MDKGGFKIQIHFEGKNLTLDVQGSSTVDQLKHKIYQWNNIAPSEQILAHEGFLLQDDKTLENQDVEIESQSTIYQTTIVTGGAGGSFVEFPFSSLNNPEEIKFSKQAPPYRIVHVGLNLEGICQKESCGGYKQRVIVPFGFGSFNLNKLVVRAQCPLCKNITKDNLAPYLYQCKYSIEGQKVESQEQFTLINQSQNDKQSCRTFKSEGVDSCQWSYLEIEVKQL